jgi:hypothetical protein
MMQVNKSQFENYCNQADALAGIPTKRHNQWMFL